LARGRSMKKLGVNKPRKLKMARLGAVFFPGLCPGPWVVVFRPKKINP